MTTAYENNKRIAKNTIMLYIRMLVSTLISLYTVRVTLQILGADDYGIYNAVCGIIGFISFISATLANSAQRYLAFDIGKGDDECYNRTFSMLIIVFVVIAFIIVIVAEIFGPWLIGNYLVIPSDRLLAAQWIFQISVITLLVRFATIPYMASIVAHERMGFYAYISIAEVILKLIIVYALVISPIDNLIAYACLHFVMDVVVSTIYIIICLKQFHACTFKWYWNKSRFKEVGGYIGWNTFGSLSATLQTQVITMVTSMFFQPAIMASRAIADKVNMFSYSFVTNFIMAGSPQLVKYYAIADNYNFNQLFYRISKFGYYLMLIIAVPLIVLMPDLLSLWLSDTLLEEMTLFSRLALINAMVSSLETPVSRAIAATGNVRLYQVLNCLAAFLGVPIIFVLFQCGFGAEWGYIVSISILFFSLFYRIVVLKKYSSISIKIYFTSVIIPCIIITAAMGIMGWGLSLVPVRGIIHRIIVIGTLSLVLSLILAYFSLQKSEKRYVNNIIFKKIYAKRK